MVSCYYCCCVYNYTLLIIIESKHMEFGIDIDDGSQALSSIIIDENDKSIELYEWQREAKDYFFKYNKAIFEVATGCGKTFCAIDIMKEVLKKDPDVMILIVVPKNIILEQTWFKELYDNGFSLIDVGVFYGFAKEFCKITITNMQNLKNVPLELFDMIILDELHNYGTKRLLKLIEYPFKYRLGLSATLDRGDGSQWEIKKIFDYRKFDYGPKKALEDGVLNPFNFINIGVKMDEESFAKYLKLTNDVNSIFQAYGNFNVIMRGNNPVKFRMLRILNERKQLVNNYPKKFEVLKDIVKKHINDKMIIFNEFNEQTNKAYWFLLDVGVKARVMHSGIPNEKRDENLKDIKHDRANILCASKVLDEGWNVPKMDVGVIMAGESSARQTIQRFGRVLRKKDKPSTIYQIYCLETIEHRDAIIRTKLFKELAQTYEERVFA